MKPDGAASNPPARLIDTQARRRLDGLADFLMGVVAAPRHPKHGLGTAAARQADAEQVGQALPHLAMRQAHALVEQGDSCLTLGPHLTGGRA